MRIKKYLTFAADFETTVYEGQEYTEVWASGLCRLGSEDVKIFHSIDDTFEYLKSLRCNCLLYYHNLKFDGTFWLSYLLDVLHFDQAYDRIGDSAFEVKFQQERFMRNNTFKYSISDRGQWYSIIIKVNHRFIEIRDSLKLLPFSLKAIGKSFKTKHQKLDMEYKGFRYAGCEITAEEKQYLKNDVLVLKEALEFMYAQGHDKLTIGSCCLSEFKKTFTKKQYAENFPDLTAIEIDKNEYGRGTADLYIRRSYKGGWCYLVPEKASKIFKGGVTADVNSLYPSMMSSESGNRYPVGLPTFWKGNTIPAEALAEDKYYFIRIKTRFYIKDGYLPFIQIKGNWLYKATECLKTSDVYNPKTGKYSRWYIDLDGETKDSSVILTLTMTDYKLFREHYNVEDFEILDGCYFNTAVGLFDEYIDKYKKIKMEAAGALRALAKLFLNNLYGQMARNDDSSFKVAFLDDSGAVNFMPVQANEKKPGFIAVGSAITSYARNFTIRAAQMNYHGPDQPGFIYADTDSIHCDLPADQIRGIKTHPSAFCCWKLESYWDKGYFVRQKTYIEHVTHEDGEPVEPWYNVKCAGMPDKCKQLFLHSMLFDKHKEPEKGYTEEEKEFLSEKRTLEEFNVGLRVPGKLMPKRIKGGTVLVDTWYEMRRM